MPSLTTLLPTCRLSWPLQEFLNQLEPVEDEKDPEVVEDHREAGGLTRGPKRRQNTGSRLRLCVALLAGAFSGTYNVAPAAVTHGWCSF